MGRKDGNTSKDGAKPQKAKGNSKGYEGGRQTHRPHKGAGSSSGQGAGKQGGK